jgi:hypothetical protein
MPNISVPVDGRAQFDPAAIMIAKASMGRWPLTAGVDTVTPSGSYILKKTWPASTKVKFDRPSTAPVEVAAPRKQDAAHALWPDLK